MARKRLVVTVKVGDGPDQGIYIGGSLVQILKKNGASRYLCLVTAEEGVPIQRAEVRARDQTKPGAAVAPESIVCLVTAQQTDGPLTSTIWGKS